MRYDKTSDPVATVLIVLALLGLLAVADELGAQNRELVFNNETLVHQVMEMPDTAVLCVRGEMRGNLLVLTETRASLNPHDCEWDGFVLKGNEDWMRANRKRLEDILDMTPQWFLVVIHQLVQTGRGMYYLESHFLVDETNANAHHRTRLRSVHRGVGMGNRPFTTRPSRGGRP